MADNDKRGEERVPAALRLKLRYTSIETFIDKYAANVSRGGIFIASRTPKAVGSVLRFEFQLADGSPVVRGEGKVVWVKEFDPGQPRKPHGMGIKFTRLDSRSKTILDRMLSLKMQARGEGSGMATLPAEASGPVLVADDSGPRPLPAEASGPVLMADDSGPRPLPAEASSPDAAVETGAPRPLPAEASGPRERVIAPTTPITLSPTLQPTLDALDRLAQELGFTDEALAAAMARARELAAGANGDLDALLRGLPPGFFPGPPRPRDHAAAAPPAPPTPGAARAVARAHSFDQEEVTDIDRAQREARAHGFAETTQAEEPPSLDLASPYANEAAPPPDDPADPPRKGRLGAVVSKIFTK